MQLDYLYKSVNSKLTKINLFFLKSPESRAAQLGQQSMLSFHTQVLSIINEHPVHLHHWSKNQGVALFSSLVPMYLFCLVPLPFQSPERITNDPYYDHKSTVCYRLPQCALQSRDTQTPKWRPLLPYCTADEVWPQPLGKAWIPIGHPRGPGHPCCPSASLSRI